VTHPTPARTAYSFLAEKNIRMFLFMRMKYELTPIPMREKSIIAHHLLNEMERQEWFAIVFLHIWKSEGLICTQ
jgi:hypothetical protein